MTNLLIAPADTALAAASITPEYDNALGWNVRSLFGGKRASEFKFSTDDTSSTIKLDLGSDYASKESQVEFLILGRADRLQDEGQTGIVLASSSDDSTYTDRITDASFASATLYGPRLQDYISTVTQTSAYRYWRLTYSASSAISYRHSACYFGSWLNLGKDPNFECEIEEGSGKPFETTSGTKYFQRAYEPTYKFRFTWQHISNDALANFYARVVFYKYKAPVYLYTSNNHIILDNQRLVHCELTEASWRPMAGKGNYNELTAEFKEVIG